MLLGLLLEVKFDCVKMNQASWSLNQKYCKLTLNSEFRHPKKQILLKDYFLNFSGNYCLTALNHKGDEPLQ